MPKSKNEPMTLVRLGSKITKIKDAVYKCIVQLEAILLSYQMDIAKLAQINGTRIIGGSQYISWD